MAQKKVTKFYTVRITGEQLTIVVDALMKMKTEATKLLAKKLVDQVVKSAAPALLLVLLSACGQAPGDTAAAGGSAGGADKCFGAAGSYYVTGGNPSSQAISIVDDGYAWCTLNMFRCNTNQIGVRAIAADGTMTTGTVSPSLANGQPAHQDCPASSAPICRAVRTSPTTIQLGCNGFLVSYTKAGS